MLQLSFLQIIHSPRTHLIDCPDTASRYAAWRGDWHIESSADHRPVGERELDIVHAELAIKLTGSSELTVVVVGQYSVGAVERLDAGAEISEEVDLHSAVWEDKSCCEACAGCTGNTALCCL